LDLVGLRYATRLNGFTEIAVTKLDTLDGLKTLKVCTGYKVNGQLIEGMPLTPDLYHVEPVYQELPGWDSTAKARSWNELPKEAQDYIKLIEQVCKAPATLISVGPERSATFSR
ncbi:MAG: adenylosuccinate synthetase, partial [Bacillota bacterium]